MKVANSSQNIPSRSLSFTLAAFAPAASRVYFYQKKDADVNYCPDSASTSSAVRTQATSPLELPHAFGAMPPPIFERDPTVDARTNAARIAAAEAAATAPGATGEKPNHPGVVELPEAAAVANPQPLSSAPSLETTAASADVAVASTGPELVVGAAAVGGAAAGSTPSTHSGVAAAENDVSSTGGIAARDKSVIPVSAAPSYTEPVNGRIDAGSALTAQSTSSSSEVGPPVSRTQQH